MLGSRHITVSGRLSSCHASYTAAPQGVPIDLSPASILAMWAAGITAGAVAVALWNIVGAGFHRIVAGSAALLAAGALLFDAHPGTVAGLVLLVAAAVSGSRSVWTAGAFAVASLCFLVAASDGGEVFSTLTGAIALGAVTDGMLLGHWYLVDPRLPRWALKSLAVAGASAILADAAVLAGRGAFGWDPDTAIVGWAFVALVAMSALLMAGVWFALREPGYSGVMAATGLSYLAVLTVVGGAIAGRSLLGEGSSLLSG